MTNPENYLLPEADDLPMRTSQDYARYKLKALTTYLSITNTAMHARPWIERFYIDLQAGPGKNQIGDQILLGSPLISLTVPYAATQFRFNEYDPILKSALEQRVTASPLTNRVKIFQSDANKIVEDICKEIQVVDKRATTTGQWSSLNIAFLDPEGLELEWATVAQLANIKRMDLIINFSTGGLVRAIGAKYKEKVSRFFGTEDWQKIDNPSYDPVRRRRLLIDFYRKRLEGFGYHIEIDPNLGGDEITVSNSKNAQVYSLIFASKHELGDKFWGQAAKGTKPPKLPGF